MRTRPSATTLLSLIVLTISLTAAAQNWGFLYSGGKFTNIAYPGGYYGDARGINNSGQIVGTFWNKMHYEAFGYVYTNGDYQSVSYPGTGHTELYGINDLGIIVGWNGANGFVDDNYNFSDLAFVSPTIGCEFYASFPYGINDGEQIAGSCIDIPTVKWRGFIVDHGKLKEIAYPGAANTYVYGINNAGAVVGYSTGTITSGFVYQNGVFTLLNVPGSGQTVPTAINNLGQVVGYYPAKD
jgi:probable HAF family extracellular repeat protein